MSESPLQGEVRFKVPLPIVLPLGGMALIAIVAIGVSRILLSVPHELAVVIGTALAANILIACTVLALRPQESRLTWAELAVAASYPLVISVLIAASGFGQSGSAEAHGGAEEAAPAAGGTAVEAVNVAFSTDVLELPADEEAELAFTNSDAASVPHNIAIYEDDSADKTLFQGETIPGGSEVTYQIDPLAKGEYYFQCDVHPGMNGTVTVE
ncbi:MAG TPA: cupredoxin domain-containing protein [Actinomycetota bacterium]|nr:cupredoxin domain-containing protein [Actinomycetota bacterium]